MTRRFNGLVAALGAAALLQGCLGAAVVGGGAAMMSAVDRRTTGTQIDDEGIELQAQNRIGERFGDRAHVNVTSFNKLVLLTGEVPDAAARTELERLVRVSTNVRGITNETVIGGISSYSARANDAATTGKVKARFLDANRFNAIHVKVVTEANIVYLLGIVTEKEAADATEIARTTGGVLKVVKVFEYCKANEDPCRPK